MALPLPNVLKDIVFGYLPNVEVLPWIDEAKLDRAILHSNPAAMHMITVGRDIPPDYWFNLCKNPAAIDFLEKNLEFVSWTYLSANPAAIHLLKKNIKLISSWELAKNPKAIWSGMPMNLRESDSHYENPILWGLIVLTDHAKINWYYASANPGLIDILTHDPRRINWNMFSANPAAIDILKDNLDKIDYKNLSRNPKIFRPAPLDEIRRLL